MHIHGHSAFRVHRLGARVNVRNQTLVSLAAFRPPPALVFVVALDLVVAPRPLGSPLIAGDFRVAAACVVARVAFNLEIIAACVRPQPSSAHRGRYVSM